MAGTSPATHVVKNKFRQPPLMALALGPMAAEVMRAAAGPLPAHALRASRVARKRPDFGGAVSRRSLNGSSVRLRKAAMVGGDWMIALLFPHSLVLERGSGRIVSARSESRLCNG